MLPPLPAQRTTPQDKMKTTATYTRKNDNKEYTILEMNEDLNQITLRDTNTGTTLKMAKQTFANNFKKI
jgi:hypothetical protein